MDSRPIIFDFGTLPDYLNAMIAWHRGRDSGFSIRSRSAAVRRCSPALVTQVLAGKRRLTSDRAGAFAKLLELSNEERTYLVRWADAEAPRGAAAKPQKVRARRRSGQNHLLKDWVNVYVKDAARLAGPKPTAEELYRLLGGMVPVERVEKALDFLLREGFLRRTLDGRIIENDAVVTTSDEIPNAKIRQFHAQSLQVARRALDLYPPANRRASAIVLALDKAGFEEVKAMLAESYEKILAFIELREPGIGEQLYQVILNLSPVGGTSGINEKS